jgi:hypothetical protein
MRATLFWDITQQRMVNIDPRFGTTCRSHLQGSRVYFVTLEDMTDTLFRNVGKKLHYALRNIPEERRSSYSPANKENVLLSAGYSCNS